MNDTQPTDFDFAAKVRRLLDLAERAGTEAERELAMAKAHEFMAKYAIDEAMLRRTDKRDDDVISKIDISFTGIFAQFERELAIVIAKASRCKVVVSDSTWARPKRYVVHVHGYTSDLERVKFLATSLQLQCITARDAWVAAQPAEWHVQPYFTKFKDRRAFMTAFTSAVGVKMREATRVATQSAARERAVDGDVAAATTGVELVLRDRVKAVDDAFTAYYGNGLRTVRRAGHNSGGAGAYSAGRSAGANADTGLTRVGGGRSAIER